jgi:hypothetical protein
MSLSIAATSQVMLLGADQPVEQVATEPSVVPDANGEVAPERKRRSLKRSENNDPSPTFIPELPENIELKDLHKISEQIEDNMKAEGYVSPITPEQFRAMTDKQFGELSVQLNAAGVAIPRPISSANQPPAAVLDYFAENAENLIQAQQIAKNIIEINNSASGTNLGFTPPLILGDEEASKIKTVLGISEQESANISVYLDTMGGATGKSIDLYIIRENNQTSQSAQTRGGIQYMMSFNPETKELEHYYSPETNAPVKE